MYRSVGFITNILDSLSIQYSIMSTATSPLSITWDEACISTHDVKEKSLFFGLQGEHTNGGKFVAQALEQGASVALIEREYKSHIVNEGNNGAVILVDNALYTMSKIANFVRNAQRELCTFIGVTGSAGKTTSKNILYHILHTYKKASMSSGNLNTVQGMSLCLLNTDWEGVHFAVFECGISATGEMIDLVDILDPDYAVLTNVGSAHMGGYRNIDELRQEKLTIACKMRKDGVLWIPDKDKELQEKAKSMNLSCQIFFHGESSVEGFLDWKDMGSDGVELHFKDGAIHVPLLGIVNVYNALLGYQVGRFFGMSFELCQQALCQVKEVSGRYQILQKKPLIIDDSYNASPEAVIVAMQWFASFPQKKKIAVLGGMRELGDDEKSLHQFVLDSIINFDIDAIILYGIEFNHCTITDNTWVKVNSTEAILSCLRRLCEGVELQEVAIIFKGSRFYGLENVAKSYMCR